MRPTFQFALQGLQMTWTFCCWDHSENIIHTKHRYWLWDPVTIFSLSPRTYPVIPEGFLGLLGMLWGPNKFSSTRYVFPPLGPLGRSHFPPQKATGEMNSSKVKALLVYSHSANGPWDKSLNFFFPTKHVIPESLKFSHWLSGLYLGKLPWFQNLNYKDTLVGFHFYDHLRWPRLRSL